MLPKVVMSVLTYRLTAMIWKEAEGHIAECFELGMASVGDSASRALGNLKEATELYVENMLLTDDRSSIKDFLQVSS